MSLDLNRIRKRQKELEKRSRSADGGFFRPSKGKNTIRVFTFQHKVNQEDVKVGTFEKEMLGKTVSEIDREVQRMFGVTKSGRPLIITSANQPAMRKYKSLKGSKSQADQKAARSCRPNTCFYMNVVNTQEKKVQILEYAAPRTVYEQILGYVLDEDYGESLLGAKGRDFVIVYDPDKEGTDMYSVRIRAEGKSTDLPVDLEKKARDFYDPEVFCSLGEFEAHGDEEEDEEKEEIPVINVDEDAKPAKKNTKKDEEEEEEDDDEEDDEEDDDEEDDDEEDDDEEDDPLDE